MMSVVDQDHAACAMHLGVDRLVGKRDVLFMRIFLRLMAENQDEFSGDVEARVVVVVFLLVGDAEAGEDDGARSSPDEEKLEAENPCRTRESWLRWSSLNFE